MDSGPNPTDVHSGLLSFAGGFAGGLASVGIFQVRGGSFSGG